MVRSKPLIVLVKSQHYRLQWHSRRFCAYNFVSPFLFQHYNAPVHKARSIQKWWKNLTGLHRALNSTPSNTFGMNWNADCQQGLITSTSGPDLTNAVVDELKQFPAAMFQSSGKPSQKSGQQRGDQLHINAHYFGMRCSTSRWPHTPGHVV
jgi:hypothetical protein